MSEPPAVYSRTLDEVRRDLVDGKAVPLAREILADLDTPVSAYLKVRGGGPSFLLESVEGGERVGRFSFIGTDPRDVVMVRDGVGVSPRAGASEACGPLDAVERIIGQYARDESAGRFEGGALGYLSYEAARAFERVPAAAADPLNLPDAAFMDVDTVLVFDHVRHRIKVVSHVWPGAPVEQAYDEARERIDCLVRKLSGAVPSAPLPALAAATYSANMGQAEYEDMVRRAKEYIRAGDLLQIVLSQRLSLPFDGDPFGLYRRLRVVSPSPYMYYQDFGSHQLVGASPELLVHVAGSTITARPIAGTRRRGSNDAEDRALADELLSDEKERAEHLMLVDLARNDLGRVSAPGSVQVESFMTVERFSHVMHIVSDVTGRLAAGCSSLQALRAAFPAGTVSGAPKIRAMELIAELEPDRRGPYAGAVGFVTPSGDMEMAITIRTGVVKEGTLHVQAGAGIVADSQPETEYIETLNKARAMLIAAGAKL